MKKTIFAMSATLALLLFTGCTNNNSVNDVAGITEEIPTADMTIRVKTVAGEPFSMAVQGNDMVAPDGSDWNFPYSIIIQWGDGTSTVINEENGFYSSHLYDTDGEAIIEISGEGDLSNISFFVTDPDGIITEDENNEKVIEVIGEN